ncbi:MFS transporter, partial [Streptomyces sp. SID8455]|nr:MFS transporter [Streptomyces sp. SID8455]
GTSPAALLDGYRAALVVPLAAALIAAAVSAFGLRRRPAGPADAGVPSSPESVRQADRPSGKVPA